MVCACGHEIEDEMVATCFWILIPTETLTGSLLLSGSSFCLPPEVVQLVGTCGHEIEDEMVATCFWILIPTETLTGLLSGSLLCEPEVVLTSLTLSCCGAGRKTCFLIRRACDRETEFSAFFCEIELELVTCFV